MKYSILATLQTLAIVLPSLYFEQRDSVHYLLGYSVALFFESARQFLKEKHDN